MVSISEVIKDIKSSEMDSVSSRNVVWQAPYNYCIQIFEISMIEITDTFIVHLWTKVANFIVFSK